MIITNIPNNERNKLFMSLEANMSSFRKRSIFYVITAHSESIACININVSGKKGNVSKELCIIYDNINMYWNVYSEGKVYSLISLSEISSIVRSIIATLSVVVNKI